MTVTSDLEDKMFSLLVSEPSFSREAIPLCEPQDFSSPGIQYVMTIIKKYFNQYKNVPTQTIVLNEIKKTMAGVRPHKDEVQNIAHAVALMTKTIPESEAPYVKNEFMEFLKNQRMRRALGDSITKVTEGKVDEVMPTIQEATRIGVVDDPGREYTENYLDRISERQSKDSELRVPTLIPPLDHLLRGGLGPEELGVILGVPKKGKSMTLVNLCFAGTIMRKRSVYISLEMSELDIMSRFDSLFTGIPFKALTQSEEQLMEHYEKIKKYSGYLFVKGFPARMCKVSTIDQFLRHLENRGSRPDMCVIDYGNLIRPERTRVDGNKYYILDEIFQDLQSLAKEWKIPIWTVARAGRKAIDAVHVTEKYTAESLAINYACDVMLSLNQTDQERLLNKMRLRVVYVRNSQVGVEIPLVTDFERAKLRYDEANVLDQQLGIELSDERKEKIQQQMHEKKVQSITDQITDDKEVIGEGVF